MMIPYIDERKKLLVLYQRRNAIYDSMATALAPLEENLAAAERMAKTEHIAAGGEWPIDWHKDQGGAQWRACMDKSEPSRQAVVAARAAFQERADAVDEQIKAIETALGSEVAEEHWIENGGCPALCAMTGLPILGSDKIAMSIVLALPQTADIHSREG